MFKKLVYFGAGIHLDIINDFESTKEFILVDSRPKNAHGFDYYRRELYQKYFMNLLEKQIDLFGLTIKSKKILTNNFTEINVENLESTLIEISHNKLKKNLSYYISTSIPYDLYDNNLLQDAIRSCDGIIISGYYPDKRIIKYLKTPINIIGYSDTYFPTQEEYINSVYTNNDSEDLLDSIIAWIIKNPHLIKSYTVVNYKNHEQYFFSSYNDFVDKISQIRLENKDLNENKDQSD
jgi:hypothetical protein